jgi:predicted TIM-barrel fold metal-dependent hydrolase
MRSNPSAARVRARLDHPVIDSDGHCIEYLPAVRDLVREIAGPSVERRFTALSERLRHWGRLTPAERRHTGFLRPPWWGLPAENTLDRATAMLPRLQSERMDELGLDFAVLYPTYGLMVANWDDEEARRAGARAYNRYLAEAYAPYARRLAPVAVIPMHTPEEAIDELRFARRELGLRAALLPSYVQRPLPMAEGAPRPALWLDTFALDSAHDYEPVWRACSELGVAASFHSGGMGWGSRASTTSYVHNHIGNFAAAGEAICRALVLGGVALRHPDLRFAFLEGGVVWATTLYADLVGHFEKRNAVAVRRYDPRRLDRAALEKLFAQYAPERIALRIGELDEALRPLSDPDEPADAQDEFARSGLRDAGDLRALFEQRFFFGCEADDPGNAAAFDTRRNPFGSRLRALFSSDIGHWDVRDMREVLAEAWEQVERGWMDAAEFRAFTFGNAVALWSAGNPDFFAGTAVADAAAGERDAQCGVADTAAGERGGAPGA